MEILSYISAHLSVVPCCHAGDRRFQDQVSRGNRAVLDSIEYALATRKQRHATSRRSSTSVPQTFRVNSFGHDLGTSRPLRGVVVKLANRERLTESRSAFYIPPLRRFGG